MSRLSFALYPLLGLLAFGCLYVWFSCLTLLAPTVYPFMLADAPTSTLDLVQHFRCSSARHYGISCSGELLNVLLVWYNVVVQRLFAVVGSCSGTNGYLLAVGLSSARIPTSPAGPVETEF